MVPDIDILRSQGEEVPTKAEAAAIAAVLPARYAKQKD